MRTIQPYNFTTVTLQYLIDNKLILPVDGNKVWAATIFPKTKTLNVLSNVDKDRIITQIDDVLFENFIVLDKSEQMVTVNNGLGKRFIKCVEIGDFNDSIKRYNQLDKPVDFNSDANAFLGLPQVDHNLLNQLNTSIELIHKPEINIDDFAVKMRPSMFETLIDHPHITTLLPTKQSFKHNNKTIIQEVFNWATIKGIKYIYCINEYRPYCITPEWTTPYVYYTIKGSF